MTEKELQILLAKGTCVVLSEMPCATPPATTQRTKAYRRPDLGNRYVRSAWEANIARYLNWLIAQKQDGIVSWEYECDEWEFPIKRGSRFYKCDFKVTMSDSVQYWEVKGHMDATSRTRLKRMKKYYPGIDIIVIANWTPDERFPYRVISYRDIAQAMKPLIDGWE